MSDDLSQMNIFQRINAAARILADTQWYKDGKNSQYSSVTIDQIRREVAQAETEAGIVVLYEEDDIGTYDFNGRTFCKIVATLTYVNIDNPEDRVSFTKTAIAQDTGDKGWNKAESMIYKNLYKALYYIGDREDDTDSMSNEEYDLITIFRCGKFHDELLRLVEKYLPEAKRMEAEQREAEKQKRREKMKRDSGNDAFFGKKDTPAEEPKTEAPIETTPEQRQEDAVIEAMGADAEFVDASAIAEAVKARRESVDVKDARITLVKIHNDDPGNEILNAYLDRYGRYIGKWPEEKVIDCYLDLHTEGSS